MEHIWKEYLDQLYRNQIMNKTTLENGGQIEEDGKDVYIMREELKI